MPQRREVLRGVSRAGSALVLLEGDVEEPADVVLDAGLRKMEDGMLECWKLAQPTALLPVIRHTAGITIAWMEHDLFAFPLRKTTS